MKFAYNLVMIFFIFLFQYSNGSNLILQSCKEASKNDPNLSYDFCFASLEEALSKCHPPPTNLEDLVGMSINLSKSNVTNMVSIISNLLENKSFDQYTKACLKDCFDLYSDSLSALDDAVVAFKSKDLDTASINLSATLDNSVTCEDQFKDKKGETSSPLTKENNVYFQLNFWLTVLPLGVAKTLIQTNPDKNCSRNPFRILSSIYQKAGFKGCYTGLGPTVSRAFPANAATIVAWELALKMLGIKHD